MKCYYVYLLECHDGSYYVGVTNDLSNRMIVHQEGFNQNCYTYTKRPVLLKYYKTFQYINDAIYYEKKIKKWSRAKKKAFFQNDWETMHEKSACNNSSSHKNLDSTNRSSEDET